METFVTSKPGIESWKQFAEVVRPRGGLLRRLDEFQDAVIVTGCQRSGTTMMSRILTESRGMVNYWFGYSDEMDAALILSGYAEHTPATTGRYCFQTTYLNENYTEYFEHQGSYKIVWVIRNPASVVYSLLYNWPARALEGTFQSFVVHQLSGFDRSLFSLLGSRWMDRVRQACLLYRVKTLQLLELREKLGKDKVHIVDYDELVQHKDQRLPEVYRFLNLEFFPEYCQKINNKSVEKKNNLTNKEQAVIRALAEPVYQEALLLKNRQ